MDPSGEQKQNGSASMQKTSTVSVGGKEPCCPLESVDQYPHRRVALHVTDMSIFRSCRLRWNWQSRMREALESNAPPRALWLGTGVHEGLQAYYEKRGDPAEYFEAWAEAQRDQATRDYPEIRGEGWEDQFNEDVALGMGMLSNYATWAKANDDFDVVACEKGFQIKDFLPPRMNNHGDGSVEWLHIDLEGRGDMIINRGPEYWVMEHKTAKSITTDRLVLEEQPGVYQYAMSVKYGVPMMGVAYNFLRKKIPTRPKVLVAGGLSKAANIDTTYDVYMACVQEHNLDPRDYAEILQQLKEKGNTFFYREDVVRAPREQELLLTRLRKVGEDMVNNPLIYASPEPLKCNMCSMTGPCIALADGSDFQFILDSRYKKRQFDLDPVLEEAALL